MKKAILSIGMVIGLWAMSTAITYGQSSEMYRANIPFDFSIGKKYFNAGEYSLEVTASAQRVFILRDLNGTKAYAAVSSPALGILRNRVAILEFERRGAAYSLFGMRASAVSAILPKSGDAPRLGQRTEPKSVIVAMK